MPGLLQHVRRDLVALLALFVALTSTGYAASGKLLPSNSVGSAQVINGSLQKSGPEREGNSRASRRPGTTRSHGRARAHWGLRVQWAPKERRESRASRAYGDLRVFLARLTKSRDFRASPRAAAGTAIADVQAEDASHPGQVSGSGDHGVYLSCLHADDLEPNDTRESATDATSFLGVAGLRWLQGTIYPAGNDDWYKLDAVDLGGKQIALGTDRSLMDVYKDGTLVASGALFYNTSPGTANWQVRVYGARLDPYFLYFNT